MASTGKVAGLVLAGVALGALVWVVGVFGLARGLEDRCLRVADERGYGAVSQSASVWPPRLTCHLSGADGAAGPQELDVELRSAALTRTAWTLGFPVLWLAAGGVLLARRTASGRSAPVSSP